MAVNFIARRYLSVTIEVVLSWILVGAATTSTSSTAGGGLGQGKAEASRPKQDEEVPHNCMIRPIAPQWV
ncbi:hypothetical protein CCB81_11435 [Armatimonadetes bacterium Uphvl-Ar2]|nr:hypothetical protein CCB81_11435 [Armatimonadetes bacterium Uphvl-Ar2]